VPLVSDIFLQLPSTATGEEIKEAEADAALSFDSHQRAASEYARSRCIQLENVVLEQLPHTWECSRKNGDQRFAEDIAM
jgi:hypothetical protein